MSNVYKVDYTSVQLANVGTSPVSTPAGDNSSGAGEQHVTSVGSAFAEGDTPQDAAAIIAAGASDGVLEIHINLVTEVATDVQVAET